jgi:hypothetical protein
MDKVIQFFRGSANSLLKEMYSISSDRCVHHEVCLLMLVTYFFFDHHNLSHLVDNWPMMNFGWPAAGGYKEMLALNWSFLPLAYNLQIFPAGRNQDPVYDKVHISNHADQ